MSITANNQAVQRFSGKFFSKDFNPFARDVISRAWRDYPKVSPFQTFREVNSRSVVDPSRISDRQIWDGVMRTSFLPEGHEYNTQLGNLLKLNASVHLMSGICAESPCSVFSSTKGLVDSVRHVYLLVSNMQDAWLVRGEIPDEHLNNIAVLAFFKLCDSASGMSARDYLSSLGILSKTALISSAEQMPYGTIRNRMFYPVETDLGGYFKGVVSSLGISFPGMDDAAVLPDLFGMSNPISDGSLWVSDFRCRCLRTAIDVADWFGAYPGLTLMARDMGFDRIRVLCGSLFRSISDGEQGPQNLRDIVAGEVESV